MKLRHALAALTLLLLRLPASAQTVVTPPNFIDYQGKALDSSGNPLAPSTPTNYTMIFRIYNAQTGGSSLWTEQQTVTVSNGLFSVQLGAGIAYLSEPNNSGAGPTACFTSTNATGSVVTPNTRYLGVTVVIPPATAANAGEITPRLAFLTAPFAYAASHAGAADSVSGVVTATAGSTFAGSGTFSGSTLTGVSGTPSIITGPVTTSGATFTGGTFTSGTFSGTVNAAAGSTFGSGTLSGTLTGGTFAGTHTGNGAGLTNLNGASLTSGTVPDAALTSNVALDNKSQTFSGNNTFSGSNAVSGVAYLSGSGYFGLNGGQLVVGANGDPKNFLQYGGNVNGSGFQGVALCGWTGGQLGYYSGAPFAPVLTWNNSGYVGIGTTTPSYPLTITNSANFGLSQEYGYLDQVAYGNTSQTITYPLSLYASQDIAGSQFLAFSDVRLKVIDGTSDGSADLATLSAIKITDFHYKDVIEKGRVPQKKVIAQQVEKVFPQAVTKITGVVPDIYQKASIEGEWVLLATDLKVGERVRLIEKGTQDVCEVLEAKADRFRTGFKSSGKEVFVYGREVNDFRSVDYEAISMLNVSATQQIKKEKDEEVKNLRQANSELQAKLAALESKHAAETAALEARLARLEQSLTRGGRPAAAAATQDAPAVQASAAHGEIAPAALHAAR
jgi:hypothetical protein